ncbi:MAG TPA: hypothetical protein VL860_04850 [Planctomycetota bacterium]|nr:hypothetical protein [Planctomycetota bacterium]
MAVLSALAAIGLLCVAGLQAAETAPAPAPTPVVAPAAVPAGAPAAAPAGVPAPGPVAAATVPDGYELNGPPVLAQGRVRFVAFKKGTSDAAVFINGAVHQLHLDDQKIPGAAGKQQGGLDEITFKHATTEDNKPVVLAYGARGVDLVGDDPAELGLAVRDGGFFGVNGGLLYYRASAEGKEFAVIRGQRHELDAAFLAKLTAEGAAVAGVPNPQRTDYALVLAGPKSGGQVISANHASTVWPQLKTLGWSPDGSTFVYLGLDDHGVAQLLQNGLRGIPVPAGQTLDPETCGFGPDGNLYYALAGAALDQGQQDVVLHWGGLNLPIKGAVQRFVLPQGGAKIAYLDRVPEGDKTATPGWVRFVIGRQKLAAYENIDGGLFSPDGTHFAYVGQVTKPLVGRVVVRDDKPSMTVTDVKGLVFSPDSQRLVYRALINGGWYLFDNDQKMGPYTEIEASGFEAASQRYQCVAQKKDGRYVVSGKLEMGPFETIEGLAFGSNGEPFFWARHGAQAAVYLGAQAILMTDGAVSGENGALMLERKNGRTLIMSDGSKSEWDELNPAVWSADRRTPVFFGRQGNQHFVRIGATLYPVKLTQVDAIQFAPDGKGVWVMGRNGRDIFVLTYPATAWVAPAKAAPAPGEPGATPPAPAAQVIPPAPVMPVGPAPGTAPNSPAPQPGSRH